MAEQSQSTDMDRICDWNRSVAEFQAQYRNEHYVTRYRLLSREKKYPAND